MNITTEKEKEKLKKKLSKLLMEDAVDEALQILTVCDEKWFLSFNEEYKKKSWNTSCCAIDLAKDFLVRDGKMTQKDEDNFGGLLSDED